MFKLIKSNPQNYRNVIRLIFIPLLITLLPFSGIRTINAEGNEPASQAGISLNALDFGVIGDGLQDDSRALQRAIDEASSRNTPLLIPPSDTPYLIRNTLLMRNNTHIIGHGATLFMPSSARPMRFIGTNPGILTSNITIEGLTLKSSNDKPGMGFFTGSLTSNIVGIFFSAVENIQLNDVTIDKVKTGLKFTLSPVGVFNNNIRINNLRVFNSGTSFYANTTKNLVMTNSLLDASAGASKHLHPAYVSGNTKYFTFDNVKFVNSHGAGLAIFNSYSNMARPKNIKVRNCIIDNAIFGIIAFSGVDNLDISGLKITNYGQAFNIWDSSGVNIRNVDIRQQGRSLSHNHRSAFSLFRLIDSNVTDINIDGTGKTGQLFVIEGASNVRITSVNAHSLNNNSLIFANTTSLVRNLVFENSRIEWSNPTIARISLRGNGSDAIFRNNTFINRGNPISSLSYNRPGTNVSFQNNTMFGFDTIPHPTCQSRTINYLNNTRIFQIN